ncbi:hypothetical protein BCON_0567g00030 [Botryotinia convoluta]|uniref:Uncharacterized protein n=1 Tax=Botryotinia convoluta TaxID=54673 RepID=A0A4Z1H7Z2_9HELO|nr:hypothetical protein BCON_0567g00030 [Botryotinia convoluta]
MILLKAVDAGLVPHLERLPSRQKAAVVRGLYLGAEFNFGQLAHAENAPSCLIALQDIRGHLRTALQPDVTTSSISPHDAYNRILINRTLALQKKGFRHLEIVNSQDRALMRLLSMGGVDSLETAQLFDEAWQDLENPTKDSLAHTLNMDGSR